MLKGDPAKTIRIEQEGGETADKIYKVEGVELLKKGDRLLLFLNERGIIITPSFGLNIDADGNIQTAYYPEDYAAPASAEDDPYTISVSDYAALITDCLAK